MNNCTIPNWVRGKEESMIPLLHSELSAIEKGFPSFQYRILEETGTLFAKGKIELVSGNSYATCIYFPQDYPNSSPRSVIEEISLLKRYTHSGIPNTTGILMGGVEIIPYRFPTEDFLQTGIDILYLTARWLSAYESWLRDGNFTYLACVHFDGQKFHLYQS